MALSTKKTLVKAKVIGSENKYRDLMPSEQFFLHVKVKNTRGTGGMATKIEITVVNFEKLSKNFATKSVPI